MMKVLSIDPGIRTTGFSVIEAFGPNVRLEAYGTIKPQIKDSTAKRLYHIFKEINRIASRFLPQALAIEDTFYSKNAKSAMILGQARGSILIAAAHNEIPIFEYAPKKVKMSVCGNGTASKQQVSYMVCKILRLKTPPKSLDISDAMAVGLCYINQRKYDD